ncbi:uncharacterized protein F54H12.2-like [Nematostella vectensis]|uniref:uncharacterized protein F54H12.2-like n=1 Tax=Nematostella vectensis TaxID=45351 RepID=UPI00207723C9|nr:uncharacterized protein F54H12.2-like [Nematostella vectensis]
MSHGGNGKFKISKGSVLRLYHVTPTDSVRLNHANEMLRHNLAKYPLTTAVVNTEQIESGKRSILFRNLFNGLVPKGMIFGIVQDAAYNGSYTKNPFNFQMPQLSSIGVKVDGNETPISSLKNVGGEAIDLYHLLFDNVCGPYRGRGLNISREEFKNGYALFPFDFTAAANASSGYFQPQYKGVVTLELTFSEATDKV